MAASGLTLAKPRAFARDYGHPGTTSVVGLSQVHASATSFSAVFPDVAGSCSSSFEFVTRRRTLCCSPLILTRICNARPQWWQNVRTPATFYRQCVRDLNCIPYVFFVLELVSTSCLQSRQSVSGDGQFSRRSYLLSCRYAIILSMNFIYYVIYFLVLHFSALPPNQRTHNLILTLSSPSDADVQYWRALSAGTKINSDKFWSVNLATHFSSS